jgi:hypothetical protein
VIQKKLIVLTLFFSIICFNMFSDLIQKRSYTVMAQDQNSCISCPKGVTFECKLELNIARRGVCQSNQEWYSYNIPELGSALSITVMPDKDTDVDLYTTWDTSCPSTSKYGCVSNSGDLGKSEECHHVFTEINSPNYILVKRVSGSGCFNILLSKYNPTAVEKIASTTSHITIPQLAESQNMGKNNLLIIGIAIMVILFFVLKFKNVY